MKLQTLYKLAKTGKTQVFNIETVNDTYTVTWGQVNGKQQSKTTTCTGKNIGKANETTPSQQADIEATAIWVKKQKANYSTEESAPVSTKLPMKVNKYKDHLKKIKGTVFTSPKLNGVNAEYRLIPGTDGKVDELKLFSRGGEEYPIPPHQEVQVTMLLQALGTNSINGEMYCHGMFLQDIMAATKKHNEDTPRLKFHVFDFPEVKGTYQERCTAMYALKEAYTAFDTSNLPFVPVWTASSPEEIDDQYEQVMAAGYEGLMVRNPSGLYEYNTRSLDVFKYKEAQDAEFKIIAVTADKNGHPVMTFESTGGEFKAKPKGTSEEREAMLKASASYIGKFATVEYEMLSKGSDGLPGKPQKPVMIGLRDCTPSGVPKV